MIGFVPNSALFCKATLNPIKTVLDNRAFNELQCCCSARLHYDDPVKKIKAIVEILLILTLGCGQPSVQVQEIQHFPLDSLDNVITASGVELDTMESADGGGSLRIIATEPVTIRLFELGDVDLENATLFYSAQLRTENLQGQTYLEMLCSFPGIGEAFSRALNSALSGTQNWSSHQTPFFLRPGENPDNVKLNLVVQGTGKVWIDDILVTKGPLP